MSLELLNESSLLLEGITIDNVSGQDELIALVSKSNLDLTNVTIENAEASGGSVIYLQGAHSSVIENLEIINVTGTNDPKKTLVLVELASDAKFVLQNSHFRNNELF